MKRNESTRFQSSDACALLLLTSTLTGTCLGRFIPRWRNWYLRFWNQLRICSSVISSPFAKRARSSRVKYCWREKTSSKYLSCNWVKWLLFRFFLTAPFDLLSPLFFKRFEPVSPSTVIIRGNLSVCTLRQTNNKGERPVENQSRKWIVFSTKSDFVLCFRKTTFCCLLQCFSPVCIYYCCIEWISAY